MKSYFFVSSNQLTGSLPTELGLMTGIRRYFRANENSLSATLPSELGQLVLLSSWLDLRSNRFCDSIPSEVAALSTSSTAEFHIEDGVRIHFTHPHHDRLRRRVDF